MPMSSRQDLGQRADIVPTPAAAAADVTTRPTTAADLTSHRLRESLSEQVPVVHMDVDVAIALRVASIAAYIISHGWGDAQCTSSCIIVRTLSLATC